MHHSFILFSLAFVGFVAGIIDTLSGGGGLLTLPALLMAGLPPALALGTNKLQGCVGEINACFHFLRMKRLNIKPIVPGLIFTSIGATGGTWLIQVIHPSVAGKIIPFLLLTLFLYMVFSPQINRGKKASLLSSRWFYTLFGLLIGFYNGFLGPGTGAIWIGVLMAFQAMSVVDATIHAKPLNFIGNLMSLLWFVVGGNVNYPVALVMAAGQLLGTWVGARLVVTKGLKLIRPVYLVVVFALLIKVTFDNFS